MEGINPPLFKEGDTIMIKNGYRYIKTIIDIEKFLSDTSNMYVLVGQRPYKGKTDDKGNVLIDAGVTVTLQIVDDNSEPIYDKEGVAREDNRLETFEATIVGANYPLNLKKGDCVCLEDFKPDISYYINYALVLRFGNIAKVG